MYATLFGIVIFVRFIQLSKTLSPILVTLSGIVILIRLVLSLKALRSILVTLNPSILAGISTFSALPL